MPSEHIAELYEAAKTFAGHRGYVTTGILQRHMKIGHRTAVKLIFMLIEGGVIGIDGTRLLLASAPTVGNR